MGRCYNERRSGLSFIEGEAYPKITVIEVVSNKSVCMMGGQHDTLAFDIACDPCD